VATGFDSAHPARIERQSDSPSRGCVESINVSRGGVPKTGVFEALVTEHGVDGDWQADRRHHGGPGRAVCLFSLELIQALQGEGHPIAAGTTGENITISGLDWPSLTPGRELRIGSVRLQITDYAAPCETIRGSFRDFRSVRISHKAHPGWSRLYTRVLTSGIIRPGDAVEVL
jgi:MOSC domain-containing protein YiiM